MTTRRVEEWTYQVRALADDGVASLDGRLTGLGGGVEVDGEEVPLAVGDQSSEESVGLRLSMDGRLVWCGRRAFDRALPHRGLALRLPSLAVLPFDEWPDPGLARPFASLLPLDLDVEVEGSSRLVALARHGATTLATVDSRGMVSVRGGPRVSLSGTASWDAERGVLVRRQLTARYLSSRPGPGQDPGVLELELFEV